MDKSGKGNVASVQVLRGFAALLVVLHHTIRAFAAKSADGVFGSSHAFFGGGTLNVLALGVDIFFVISGFIMVYVSRSSGQGSLDFLARRFIRIFPMYWIMTGVIVAGALWVLRTGQLTPSVLSWPRLVASAALFPSLDANGLVRPILGVGWTLSYELLFYLLFAVALLARSLVVGAVASLLAVVFVVAQFALDSNTALGMFLSDPIMFEFALGCVIAEAYCRGRMPRVHPVAIAAALAIAAYCAGQSYPEKWRVIYLGLPAAVIVCALLSMNPKGAFVNNPVLQCLGDASYSIYLAHLTLIYSIVIKPVVAMKIPLSSSAAVDIGILGAVIAACVGGIAIHKLVEARIHRWLMRAYKDRFGASLTAAGSHSPRLAA